MKLLKDAVFVVSTWKCVNLSLYVYHKRLFHNVHIFSYIIKMLQPWQTRIYNATIKIKRICSYQRSKIRLSVRPGQMSLDNQKYWCGCPTDNHKFLCLSCETRPHVPCPKYGQPTSWTDNQKLYPGCPWDNHLFFLNSNTGSYYLGLKKESTFLFLHQEQHQPCTNYVYEQTIAPQMCKISGNVGSSVA